jgi:hypothetical protein
VRETVSGHRGTLAERSLSVTPVPNKNGAKSRNVATVEAILPGDSRLDSAIRNSVSSTGVKG